MRTRARTRWGGDECLPFLDAVHKEDVEEFIVFEPFLLALLFAQHSFGLPLFLPSK
jgi:hypothetical protein